MTLTPRDITAQWLSDGFARVTHKPGPPDGLEFDGIELESTQDPVLELDKKIENLDGRIRLRDATAEGLHQFRIRSNDRSADTRTVAYLLRLATLLPSSDAALAVLQKLQQRSFRQAVPDEIGQALVGFVVAQTPPLRLRLEAALRNLDGAVRWRSSWAIALTERDLAERPRDWLQILSSRSQDLEAEISGSFNPAQGLMRSLSRSEGNRAEVVAGLSLGKGDTDEAALKLLFSDDAGDFSISRRHQTMRDHSGYERSDVGRTDEYVLELRIGWRDPVQISSSEFLKGRKVFEGRMTRDADYAMLDSFIEEAQAWEVLIQVHYSVNNTHLAEPVR